MDQQGAGRTRSAADMRRQPSWPPPGGTGYAADAETTGPLPVRSSAYGAASGPQRVLGPGTGPGRVMSADSRSPAVAPGSGAHRVLGPGTGPNRLIGADSGARPVLGRGTSTQPVQRPGSGAQPVVRPGSGAQPVLDPGSGPQASPWFVPQDSPADQDGGAVLPDDAELITLGRASTGPSAGPPPGRRRGGRARRGRARRIAWLAAAVVVLAGAGFAGYKFLYVPRVNAPVPSTLRLPTTAPGSPGFDKALGKWQHIGNRSQDPQALTIAALYPPQFTLDGTSYVRTAAIATKTCSAAVYGPDLQAALQTGKCTQVLRASYLSGDGTMMGTVGVINLASSSAAQKAGQVTGPQEIIMPLTGKKGPTKKLGTGTGVVQAEIKGHYLILMWAEYANLKSPSGTAQRQALEKFAATLVTGSANINLSTRMLTGKP
jgi:hypothetical protein